MWMMVKEGGWGALFALGVGSLGIGLGIVAVVLLVFSRKGAHAVGLATLALAFLAPMLGVLGMGSGRHKVDSVLGMVDGRGMKARLRHQGYLEAQSAARVGAYFAILPLLLGATAAFLGARKKPEDGPGNGRWISAGVVSGITFLMTGAAFAAANGPLPPDMPKDTADLLDARDRVDTSFATGCSDLSRAIESHNWHTSDKTQWPRKFEPDPRVDVPDFDAVATRCARAQFDDAKAGHAYSSDGLAIRVQDVLASPLLVDDGLRREIQDEIKKPNDFGYAPHDIGDAFARPGVGRLSGTDMGITIPSVVRLGLPTVSGRLPPEIIQRIVRQNTGRYRLCYDDGLRKDRTLAGQVKVKFVIGKDGSVSTTSDGGSDLPDKDVVHCVVKAFGNLSFPQPEGGIVTVTFPLTFTAGT